MPKHKTVDAGADPRRLLEWIVLHDSTPSALSKFSEPLKHLSKLIGVKDTVRETLNTSDERVVTWDELLQSGLTFDQVLKLNPRELIAVVHDSRGGGFSWTMLRSMRPDLVEDDMLDMLYEKWGRSLLPWMIHFMGLPEKADDTFDSHSDDDASNDASMMSHEEVLKIVNTLHIDDTIRHEHSIRL